MITIDDRLQPADLLPDLQRMWELSAAKLVSLQETWKPEQGTPVFTVGGRYTSQGWTEWTQGFQFGSAILQFDATRGRTVPGVGPFQHDRPDGFACDAHRRA